MSHQIKIITIWRQLFNLNLNFSNDSASSNSTASHFRLCTLNRSYQLCKSYPALFLVAKEISDDCVRKNAKCHRQSRLPVAVWRHLTNKAILLRSSGFHGKGFIGMLMKGQTTSGSKQSTICFAFTLKLTTLVSFWVFLAVLIIEKISSSILWCCC